MVPKARAFAAGSSTDHFRPDRTVLTAPPRSHAPIYVCVHRDKSGQACGVDYAIWRFYLDGETTASVELQMSQAAFVGNADPSAPWDNEWFGKNSKFGGWHVNVPIPFTHSVRVTLQLPEWWNGTERIFAMVRGVEDLPVRVNSFELPVDARLVASVKNSSALAPLGFHDMINLPAGTNGLMLGTMIDIRMYGPGASSLNTLEGCWHAYSPPDTRTCAHARTQLQLQLSARVFPMAMVAAANHRPCCLCPMLFSVPWLLPVRHWG